jgi:hypothetical protein
MEDNGDRGSKGVSDVKKWIHGRQKDFSCYTLPTNKKTTKACSVHVRGVKSCWLHHNATRTYQQCSLFHVLKVQGSCFLHLITSCSINCPVSIFPVTSLYSRKALNIFTSFSQML